MAQIDPELQKRLNATVLSFAQACDRIRDAATVAGLAVTDLAFETDEDAKHHLKKCEELQGYCLARLPNRRRLNHKAEGKTMDKNTQCAMPGCGRVTEVYGSKWCAECWYPGIDIDHDRYRDFRAEGHPSYQAKLMVGWADQPEDDISTKI